MSKHKRFCPKCGSLLVKRVGQYGPYHACALYPHLCDIVWNGRSFADKPTRTARQRAHHAFDRLWHGPEERQRLYADLATFMGLSPAEAHIGAFTIEQCEAVMRFAEGQK
ncbi:MAG: topoisomerase DNA-binding C4 zinc finger domain-containing protein [Candidatus Atribacteria bacterium]|nr:topoisomerase DNA-binding C4 zinc finger domain-containing protein [Candidatus Atribacteria bacterium]